MPFNCFYFLYKPDANEFSYCIYSKLTVSILLSKRNNIYILGKNYTSGKKKSRHARILLYSQ